MAHPSAGDVARLTPGTRVRFTRQRPDDTLGRGHVVGFMRFGEMLKAEAARLGQLAGGPAVPIDHMLPPGIAAAGLTLDCWVVCVEFDAAHPANKISVTIRLAALPEWLEAVPAGE